MSHRCSARAAVLVLFFFVAAAAVSAEAAYRIGVLRGPTAVAFAPMMDEGATLPDEREVEIVVYPTPPNLIAAFLNGEVQAATLPSNAAAQLAGRGVPVEVTSTFIWGVLYLVGPEGVELDALRGPVYSIGRGVSPDVVLRYVLEEEGLDDQIDVAYGFAQVELSQLLIAGRVDAGVLPEPFVTRVLAENDNLGIVADLQELFFTHARSELPQTVLAVRRGDGVAEDLVGLLRTSVDEVLSSPDATAELVEGLDLGLDAATVREALPRLNLRVESAAESRDALERYLSLLFEFEPASVGGALPAAGFYGE